MLDKQRTVELAMAAGLPAPRQWVVTSAHDELPDDRQAQANGLRKRLRI